MLHGNGIERRANGLNHCGARGTVIAEYPDLDQFMAFQGDVDFAEHGWCQAGIADQDHRLQMMRPGFRARRSAAVSIFIRRVTGNW